MILVLLEIFFFLSFCEMIINLVDRVERSCSTVKNCVRERERDVEVEEE